MKNTSEGNRNIILIGAIAVILILTVLIVYFIGNKPSEQEQALSRCLNMTGSNEKNLCFAVENKSASYCDVISEQTMKDECYTSVGEVLGDEEICKMINRMSQMYSCYNRVAMAKQHPEVCAVIIDQYYRANCYTYVAVKSKNITVCDGLTNNYYKNSCYDSVRSIQ